MLVDINKTTTANLLYNSYYSSVNPDSFILKITFLNQTYFSKYKYLFGLCVRFTAPW